jgi:hypothetical protein
MGLGRGGIFAIIPHVTNATALKVAPTLQVTGVDATPRKLLRHDGSAPDLGEIEKNNLFTVWKSGTDYRFQPRRDKTSLFNILEDAGRFSGSPEPITSSAQAYDAVRWLNPYNGATLAAGPKFASGDFSALDPDMQALRQKLHVSEPDQKYGVEFFTLRATA